MPHRYFTVCPLAPKLALLLFMVMLGDLEGKTCDRTIPLIIQEVSIQELGSLAAYSDEMNTLITNRPNPLLHLFRIKKKENRRVMAALLAFPFPFGIVGLHRIYLGTAPSVPVVYIASLGGAFGVLPLIDFFVIVFSKDHEKFVNNQKVFMWVE